MVLKNSMFSIKCLKEFELISFNRSPGLIFVNKSSISPIPLFVITFLLTCAFFDRPGPQFVYSLGGIVLIIPTLFLITCICLNKINGGKNQTRNPNFN